MIFLHGFNHCYFSDAACKQQNCHRIVQNRVHNLLKVPARQLLLATPESHIFFSPLTLIQIESDLYFAK